MVASLGAGISFAVNGQKHNLDPGVLPCTTLYDFLRGRTTYTVILLFPSLCGSRFNASRPGHPSCVMSHAETPLHHTVPRALACTDV